MKANITHDAWLKMQGFVDLCPDEISGLGKVEVVDGEFYVTDIAIFTQTVSPTHSTIPSKALAQFQVELIKKGENPKDWWCWWHSHAKMEPFFSGTDKATVESSTDFDMLLSIVSNHKHAFYAQFDMHRPLRLTQVVSVEVLEEENEEITAWVQAEYDAKVTRPVVPVYNRGFGFSPKTTSRDDDDWDGLPTTQPKAGDKIQGKPVMKQSLIVNADDLAEYQAELAALGEELKDARHRKDGEAIREISSEIYEKQIDGFYCGYEQVFPTRKI